MIGLTLAELEQELLDIADSWDCRERLRSLARRIAVQIETEKLASAVAPDPTGTTNNLEAA